MIRFGLQLPNFLYPGVADVHLFERVLEIVQAADESIFDAFFVMDHVQQIAPLGDPADPMLESYTLLGALAARTSRIKLGTMVTGVVYRNPALLAKIVTTLDVISQGRAILGLGAAWNEDEATRYGYGWPSAGERLDRLEDALRICRAMFTQDRATIQGRHHHVREALNFPRPVQAGGPKILVGGAGEKRTLRLTAQYADAWNGFESPDLIGRKLSILDQHCRDVGRDPAEIARTRLGMLVIAPTETEADRRLDAAIAGLHSNFPEDQLRARFVAGDPDRVAEQIQAHFDAGLDGVILSLPYGTSPEDVALAGRTLKARFG